MSISGPAGRAVFNTAVSSGLDSISSGISKSVEGGGIKADAIQSFRTPHGDSALLTSPRDPAFQIAASGQIPEPGNFFNNLTAAQKSTKGIPTTEIADKLKPNSNLDLKRSSADLKNSFQEEIKKWEEKLNSLGDDAQLANVDLQNILQKQQQTLQMMSNISKMLYDTAQSVIRKMGG
jgi:hypothetical protein